MVVYYNDNEPYVAAWLRNLIAAGHLPEGDVDERSIVDVRPDELRGYRQCHFFAGIGGWPLALELAGWPSDAEVWTGSCPCQPLSSAGQQKGHADERHLWPAFHALIDQCRPATVLGEQVASKDGREWFAGVRADLEALGYACGAADLCAAGVGAPHIRQRLWWVADSASERCREAGGVGSRHSQRVADAGAASDGLEHAAGYGRHERWSGTNRRGTSGGCWSDAIWLSCADGKARRIEPGIEPLAHGIPNRVGRLRAYGNAIVPQVAAEFVRAFMECGSLAEVGR